MRDRPNDRFDHGFPVFRQMTIPEAQDAKVLALEKRGTLCVIARAIEMLAAIQLDDQSALQAGEVCDIAADRHLAPKASAWNLATPQLLPKHAFGIRHCLAKFPRKLLGT